MELIHWLVVFNIKVRIEHIWDCVETYCSLRNYKCESKHLWNPKRVSNSGLPLVPRSKVYGGRFLLEAPISSMGLWRQLLSQMLHLTGENVHTIGRSLVWVPSVRPVGFLVFPSCSVSTMDLNTQPKVRVRRRPLEWSFQKDMSETLIPSGHRAHKATCLWPGTTSNGALCASQLAQCAWSTWPFYLWATEEKLWEGILVPWVTVSDFPRMKAGVSDRGGSDGILVFQLQLGLSLCMKRETFELGANFFSEVWRCRLKGFIVAGI